MKYLKEFSSVTYVATSNQFYAKSDGVPHTGRVFYKLYAGGDHRYSFLFSSVTDGTVGIGDESRCNMIFDEWDILSMRLCIVEDCPVGEATEKVTMSDDGTAEIKLGEFYDLTFDGKKSKTVAPGEFFSTDPIRLSPKDGDFFCLEITFKGEHIPTHFETRAATFVLQNGEWVRSTDMPLAGMVGSDRPVKHRIAYFGDSITAGVGTDLNAYEHWNALVSEGLGKENAYWNLGIGYGTAKDAASNGAWMFKAKQNDFVVLCFGVNDLFVCPENVVENLREAVRLLLDAGIKVFIQTLPPFDQDDEWRNRWLRANERIRKEIVPLTVGYFEPYKAIAKSEDEPCTTVYGAHPNGEGCKKWAEMLLPVLREALKKTYGDEY